MLSMRGLFFRAVSTFPKDTYSPACSFTRSFLRSENRKWRIGMLCLTEQQTFLWRNSDDKVRWFRIYSPTICKQPSGWTSPTSPVQNQRCPASSTQKLSFSPSPSLPKYPMATFGPPIKISPRGCGASWLVYPPDDERDVGWKLGM